MVKESFEDLMMGNVSENVSEDDEQFNERLREVQAKLAQIAKDEGSTKGFDEALAKIVVGLPMDLIKFIGFLIDHELPSLTALASISLLSEDSRKVVKKEFSHFLDEPGADFRSCSFSDPKVAEQISLWWTLMIFSDHHSKTVRIKDLEDKKFHEELWATIKLFAEQYLQTFEDLQYNHSAYEKALKQYVAMFYRSAT